MPRYIVLNTILVAKGYGKITIIKKTFHISIIKHTFAKIIEFAMERTYAGIPEEYAGYENAKVVVLPVPYDETSTWVKGADQGPEAFLEASENIICILRFR